MMRRASLRNHRLHTYQSAHSASRVRDASATLTDGPADAPDRSGTIVGDEKRAVCGRRDSGGTPPDLTCGCDEPGHEVLVCSGRLSECAADADHLVAGA